MDSENNLELAHTIAAHYQRLAIQENGESWRLGLFMAKYWVGLLQTPSPNQDDVLLFIQTLEAESANQGSEWLDLLTRVRNWAGGLK